MEQLEAYVDQVLDRQSDERTSVVYKVLNQGSGIQGVSGIMRRYGHDLDFLMGKHILTCCYCQYHEQYINLSLNGMELMI